MSKTPAITKTQALAELFYEHTRQKNTPAGIKRVVRACKALGFTYDELIQTLGLLDYCDHTGTPYSTNSSNLSIFASKIWTDQRDKMPGDQLKQDLTRARRVIRSFYNSSEDNAKSNPTMHAAGKSLVALDKMLEGFKP